MNDSNPRSTTFGGGEARTFLFGLGLISETTHTYEKFSLMLVPFFTLIGLLAKQEANMSFIHSSTMIEGPQSAGR